MNTTTTDHRGRTRDQHGVPMSGTSDAIALYDRAIDRMLRFHPEVLDLAGALTTEAADAPMGHALVAYLHLGSTDVPDLEGAAAAHREMSSLPMNERERLHAAAISAWLAGDWNGAAQRLDDVLRIHPGDLLALAVGHQIDFFLGDAGMLRDRPARSAASIDPSHPHTGFVKGMRSFGLEESGHYGQAEEAGLAALAINADDVWAVHAVVHCMEMQGRVAEGIRFMLDREADWGAGNMFTVHNWWHLALFCLEAGRPARALDIYDAQVHHAQSAGIAIEMLDASALLWRLYLDDIDTGDRFEHLAAAWAGRAALAPWYAFNDTHAVMALTGAGRMAEAHAVIRRLEGYLDQASGTNARMTAEIGLPACRAIVAFAEGRHADVIGELAPIRRVFHHFGGSHAQRDVLQRTLLESALRTCARDLAHVLLAERLALRETSAYSWTQRSRLLYSVGATGEADAALDRASRLSCDFAESLR